VFQTETKSLETIVFTVCPGEEPLAPRSGWPSFLRKELSTQRCCPRVKVPKESLASLYAGLNVKEMVFGLHPVPKTPS
jgi:hypothetical protein